MRAPAKPPPPSLIGLAALVALTACTRPSTCRGDYCGTLVFAAAGQPDILLPPVSVQGLARDVYQQIFLKLADIGPSMNTLDRKSTRLNSSHLVISYAVFCLKKK